MDEASLTDAWADLIGERVVLDTACPVVYLGTLASVDEYFIALEDADIYDVNETQATKAMLLMEARRNGIVPNRDEIRVKQTAVLSLSRLRDIRLF